MKCFAIGVAVAGAMALSAWGQQPLAGPHIGYAYPAGGCRGSSFAVTVGGQFLDGVTNAVFSQGALAATVLRYEKVINQGQINKMRDELRELMEKRKTVARQVRTRSGGNAARTNLLVWTQADTRALAEIQRKMEAFQRQPSSPAIADTVIMRVNIDSNATPGKCELRLRTTQGLSNPLVFCIGTLPEVCEPPPAQENFAGQFRKSRILNEQTPIKSRPEIRITLPTVVNGQVYPSEVDRYRFSAKKGQQLVAMVSARDLVPYLADAVPGWFQATVSLYDAKGKELAYADDFRFQPDPVLHFEIPTDGEYVIELKDAIFRGREDFVYRLTLGELPYLTGIFPLGGKAGTSTEVQLRGWNLPQDTVTNSYRQAGTYPISVGKGEHLSNVAPFLADELDETFDKEPNNNAARAQVVKLPVIINGRINHAGDTDLYRFDGQAGEEIVVEVVARRLMSPLDSTIRLTDGTGNQVAFNDDCQDRSAGLETHHADSFLRARLPATGSYSVQIADAQRQGGEEYAYRLRIAAPRPDFELRIVPASINGRAGLCYPVTCYAIRKDGFKGEIKLSLLDAPPGFSLAGGVIPEGQDQIRATLGFPAAPMAEPTNLVVQGRATAGGQTIVRKALAAEDMMQAFYYRHLVTAADLSVFAGGRSWMRNPLQVASRQPLKIPVGGTVSVALAGPTWGFADRVQLELSQPPEGIEIDKISSVRDRAEIVFKGDAKLKPGLKGNLIVDILPGKNAGAGAKGKAAANRGRVVVGSQPAIPFEVVR